MEPGDREARRRVRTKIARLEADIAYFQARLEVLGEPQTTNQQAQRKLFRLLHRLLWGEVVRERRRLLDQQS
jgi:hypothetical protein